MASGFKFTDNSVSYDTSDLFIKKEYFNEGGLYAFGLNTSGELGLGDALARSSPVQVGSNKNWIFLSDSRLEFKYLCNSNQEFFGCGKNDFGQLGLGDTTYRSSPVKLGQSGDWKTISCGTLHTLLLKYNGTLWSCGYNISGQLGLGDITNRSSPIQVGNLSNWKKICAGYSTSFAIKDDGTLWGWGSNNLDVLCIGDVSPRSSPVQIGSASDWVSINGRGPDAFAISANGSLFHVQSTITPVTGVNETGVGWKQVVINYYSYFGIRKDGTLWAWGTNSGGQLGLNNTATTNSPTQVGLLSDWKYIGGSAEVTNGTGTVYVIKTDGSLWGWGDNSSGQLCDGTTTFRSSPIRIGNLNNWKTVNGVGNGAYAIQDNISTF